jgi:hypothetical protein
VHVEAIVINLHDNLIVRVSTMSSGQKPLVAFILSLLSGVFIILSGVIWSFWLASMWDFGWMGGMMHGWNENVRMWNLGGTAYMMGIVGIILGMFQVLVAIMLYVNPRQHELWGALIIVFAVASILGAMGGMAVGLIMGIVGGILAILWRPLEAKPT